MLDGVVAFNASKGEQERRSVSNADRPLHFDIAKPLGQVRWTGEGQDEVNSRSEKWDEEKKYAKEADG